MTNPVPTLTRRQLFGTEEPMKLPDHRTLRLPTGVSAGGVRQTSDHEHRRQRPTLAVEGIGPWNGTVTVTPITPPRSKSSRQMYDLNVQWLGPPMVGTGGDPTEVAQRSDCLLDSDGELLQRAARIVVELLRKPEVPDLRAIVADLRRRAA